MRIEGKVVLITGASEGIGAACAAEFRRRGARLSLTARSEDKLRQVGGTDALITAGDITYQETRQRVVDRTIERYGSLDILINNAGMGMYTPAWKAPLSETRRLFDLNYFAPLAMAQLAAPHMIRQRSGTIVNLSSIGGKMTLPWLTIYSTSKYAVCSLTDGLRMELKRYGIHAITVCPGYVDTGFQDHAMGTRPPERMIKGRRYTVTAEECARAMANGVERDARTVMAPWTGWILIALYRLFPDFIDARLVGVDDNGEAAR